MQKRKINYVNARNKALIFIKQNDMALPFHHRLIHLIRMFKDNDMENHRNKYVYIYVFDAIIHMITYLHVH